MGRESYMPFSARSSLLVHPPNALANATRGRALLDLTASNPTTAGIRYPETDILAALSDRRALVYAPEALGLASARGCVAALYDVPPARVAITASTSEAYGALFKLFCDPGDEVLVPTPSYPLLAWLAALDAVRLVPYPLVHAGGWHVDLDALRGAVTKRTRAIVVVTPNNPTGNYLGAAELEAMLDLDLPIVADEVFATYPLDVPEGRVRSVLEAKRGEIFALSGLSKRVGLPQMKLGWIVARTETAMDRVETILDSYLSVATPVQHALPSLLASGAATARAIGERTRANLTTLRTLVVGSAATVLPVEGGWYAILRVPETYTDEEWCLRLALEDAVHVQPGYFFDLVRGAHLVVSLLPKEDVFREAVSRIVRRVDEGS
jgi:aspartate/methionine/tyrosine aminotransferase